MPPSKLSTTTLFLLTTQTLLTLAAPLSHSVNRRADLGVVTLNTKCTASFACGPKNAAGQDSIAVCQAGLWVHLDACDQPGANVCQYINGSPFCVAGTAAAVPVTPPPATNNNNGANAGAGAGNGGAVTTPAQPQPAGQGFTQGGNSGGMPSTGATTPVTPPATNNNNNGANAGAGAGNGGAVTTTPAQPQPAGQGFTQIGAPCTTTFSCGPTDAKGQDSINVCQGGVWAHLDACDMAPNNACQYINGSPFCVAGKGGNSGGMPSTGATTPVTPPPTNNNNNNNNQNNNTPAPAPVPQPAIPAANNNNIPASAFIVDTNTPFGAQGLTACQYDIILKLTSIYETSSPNLNYGICGNINDGNGISTGFIQFTTKSGSALSVIQTYIQDANANPNFKFNLQQFIPALSAVKGTGSVTGLDNFCSTWTMAATDPIFQSAQRTVQSKQYLSPNNQLIASLGLKTATGVGQLFDAAIQLGMGGATTIANAVTAVKSPANGGNEVAWISEYLKQRTNYINNLGGAYPPTVTRVNSYAKIVQGGNVNFDGGMVVALDNSGNPVTLKCFA
ncbi:hypothetical protein HDU76_007661 [Blyttiomyces sp. JEL0837]|nr:hypothetical protein HDU76_007661 [Blyttiomyces sp. JEL0837]